MWYINFLTPLYGGLATYALLLPIQGSIVKGSIGCVGNFLFTASRAMQALCVSFTRGEWTFPIYHAMSVSHSSKGVPGLSVSQVHKNTLVPSISAEILFSIMPCIKTDEERIQDPICDESRGIMRLR